MIFDLFELGNKDEFINILSLVVTGLSVTVDHSKRIL